jgi:DNA-binding transcriptional MerR regulator
MTDTAKSAEAYRTIGEVADEIGVPQHVLRFWETKFTMIRPLKRGGNRRYYRPEDVLLLRAINVLLYAEGYTIRGVQKMLREQGARAVIGRVVNAPIPETVADLDSLDTTASPMTDMLLDAPELGDEPSDDNVDPPRPMSPLSVPDLTPMALDQDTADLLASLRQVRARLAQALEAA